LLTVDNSAQVERMSKSRKKRFGQPKSRRGKLARALSVSFYPSHRDILRRRERELNVHRSILLQLLLEIEDREGFLRHELIARLQPNPDAAVAA
jgi:hypothetical protein